MEKQKDAWSPGDPRQTLEQWPHAVVRSTIDLRFTPEAIAEIDMALSFNNGTVQNKGKVTIHGNVNARCPECAQYLRVHSMTNSAGAKVYWLQCCVETSNHDHGYGSFSRHSKLGTPGRNPGGGWKRRDPKPDPKPEPETPKAKPLPVPTPVIPDQVIHPELLRVWKYVAAGQRNLYFYGPAGTGKSHAAGTHLAMLMAADPRWHMLRVVKITTNQTKPVSDFEGFLDRLGGGQYRSTELIDAMQQPSLIILEEADKGNPNQAGFWNPLTANGQAATPGGTFYRHPDCVIVFIGNTTGHQPSKQYRGSVGQDLATIDRFRVFTFDYVDAVERRAVECSDELFEAYKALRQKCLDNGSQRIVGTRWLGRAAEAMIVEGFTAREAIEKLIKDESWSKDERLSVGL